MVFKKMSMNYVNKFKFLTNMEIVGGVEEMDPTFRLKESTSEKKNDLEGLSSAFSNQSTPKRIT